MKQVHKRFDNKQVKEMFKKYEQGKLKREALEEILSIKRTHFFRLLKQYRRDTEGFNIEYKRKRITNKLEEETNNLIVSHLQKQHDIIKDVHTPIHRYNYSLIAQEILKKNNLKVSVQTIINRAKSLGRCKNISKHNKAHDRSVLTNNIGELIQHDSSHHLFAPHALSKWYLITSLDGFSRLMLEARFVEREGSIE
ncbi:MAG: hypothetical protein LBC07_04650, partial [Elusimicrobiota bacterium]|nr:hypothetical protein [Elusimicrobiota bacterium]